MRHRGLSRVRAAGVAAAIAVLSLTGITMGAPGASASESDTIATLVNQARTSAGLPGLIHNPSLDAVAVQWANQMGAANVMSHNPSYSSQIPGGWTRAGENVAMGQPTPSEMHTAWMNSEGHRANILGDFTDIGIAFVTVNGTTWGVEDFGKYAGHAAAAAPPVVAAPAPARKSVVTPAAPVAPAPAPVVAASVVAAPAPTSTAAARAPDPVLPESAGTPSTSPSPFRAMSETALPRASDASLMARSEASPTSIALSTAKSTPAVPLGYIIGGILVLLGVAGGIYGQTLRRRGRRGGHGPSR